MKTDLIINSTLLILSLNILFQLYNSVKYHSKFILQFLANEKCTWNPNIDRIKLAASISFTLFSIILSKLVIKSNVNIFEIIIVIVSVIILSILIRFTINKSEDSENKTKKIESLIFKPLDKSVHDELKNKIIDENRAIINDSELLTLSQGKKLEYKLKWIDKIGQKATKKSRNNEITYGFIFDIFHEYLIEDGIKNLKRNKRKELLNFIIENFSKDDQKIKYENINKSFTNWKPITV